MGGCLSSNDDLMCFKDSALDAIIWWVGACPLTIGISCLNTPLWVRESGRWVLVYQRSALGARIWLVGARSVCC